MLSHILIPLIPENRMFKLYQSLALFFLNLTIFMAVSLLCLWGALELRHIVTGRGSVVVSDVIKFESFSLTTQEVAKATAAEFDEYASSQPFVFNPWTTFMLAPVRGKYLNVIEGPLFNHRITTGGDSQLTTGRQISIWCFGGSTLYGFGVPDSQSIPSHLQRILNENKTGQPVNVVNFGQPYWFSTVEVAAYNAMLQSDYRPDIVIFVDGLNDMANLVAGRNTPFFSNQANAAWERRRNDARRMLPWLSINESFPITRVARFVEYQFHASSPQPAAFRPLEKFDEGRIVRTYMGNIRKAKALSDAYGVKSYFFLQPIPWHGQYAADTVNTSFPFGDRKAVVSVYEKITALFAKRTDAIDLHKALLSHEAPFVDNIHYSDSANALLAEAIAETVLRNTE